VVKENGKNIVEARASVAKGQETVEWACSLPQLCQGKVLQVIELQWVPVEALNPRLR
jgi:malonate-semialdehyde dehydrogenase (acetylating) / methylmalonate-semialdehyde dehydrogenase